MKKYLIPLVILIILASIYLVITSKSNIVKSSEKRYVTKTYSPGDYLIGDRNYFVDIEDFRTHVCRLKNVELECGYLTQSDNKYVLTISVNAMDDSIANFEDVYTLEVDKEYGRLYVSKVQSRWTCHENRGSTTWTIVPCK